MKYTFTAAIAALSLASSAGAATLFSNNFDAEAGGGTQLNYASFNGLTVSGGTVDVLGPGNGYGLPCVSGSCVDLDGSTGDAGYLTSGFYAFNAGDTVTFSFDLAGNHRGGRPDTFSAGIDLGSILQMNNVVFGGAYGPFSAGNILASGVSLSRVVADNQGYQNYSISFTAGSAGTVRAWVGDNGADNVGPLLDNFLLTASGAVPEPATWAMMILGFGAAGSMIRRRKALTA